MLLVARCRACGKVVSRALVDTGSSDCELREAFGVELVFFQTCLSNRLHAGEAPSQLARGFFGRSGLCGVYSGTSSTRQSLELRLGDV